MMTHPLANKLCKTYRQRFGEEPALLVQAPGRINLIGEHTDYNHGYVLPAAIKESVWFAVGIGKPGMHEWYAFDSGRYHDIPIDIEVAPPDWAQYFVGAYRILSGKISGQPSVRCVFGSDLPIGAGLSSSSALTSGFLLGMNALFQLHYEPSALAWLAHLVEHDFIGLQGGIMDQHACLLGKKDHFLLLNCLDRSFRHVPFDHRDEVVTFLINTNVEHKLTETDYNTRAEECRRALGLLKPLGIETLHEITDMDLSGHAQLLGPVLLRRLKFVQEENRRVLNTVSLLKSRDWAAIGSKLHASHSGLRDMYEVSCPELDFLVEYMAESGTIYGSRMMGGGFGGCTINIAPSAPEKDFFDALSRAYEARFSRLPDLIHVNAADGARVHPISH